MKKLYHLCSDCAQTQVQNHVSFDAWLVLDRKTFPGQHEYLLSNHLPGSFLMIGLPSYPSSFETLLSNLTIRREP